MPSGVVEDENDGSMKAGAGLACEGFEQRLEERLRDAVMHIPEGLAARGRHEGGDVEPVETMMPWRDRAFADRRPNSPRNRLQAEPMLVAREDLDRPLGCFAVSSVMASRQLFLNAAASSGEADFGFFGRGVSIDMPQAFNASQPRWTATRSSPSSRAMKAATLALVHKPPSSGGSSKRTRSCREPRASTRSPPRRYDGVDPPRNPGLPRCCARRAARSSGNQTRSSPRLRRRCAPWPEARSSENAAPRKRRRSKHTDHATLRRSNARLSSS